jgi:hypothetical protein
MYNFLIGFSFEVFIDHSEEEEEEEEEEVRFPFFKECHRH